jgi:heme-degrading monooxygenase HmoA
MMTIVTHVHLREGAGRNWDAAMRTRLSAAKKASGWVGGQLLRPADKPDRRVIVGTWRTRANWEAWHHDSQFTETRQRLDGLERARHPSTGGTTSCSMSGKPQHRPRLPPSLQASGGRRARRRAHEGEAMRLGASRSRHARRDGHGPLNRAPPRPR